MIIDTVRDNRYIMIYWGLAWMRIHFYQLGIPLFQQPGNRQVVELASESTVETVTPKDR